MQILMSLTLCGLMGCTCSLCHIRVKDAPAECFTCSIVLADTLQMPAVTALQKQGHCLKKNPAGAFAQHQMHRHGAEGRGPVGTQQGELHSWT